MNVLVLGSGGREHALALRMSEDPGVNSVFVFPGNPGMKRTPGIQVCGGVVSLASTLELVKKNQIQFVVVGPEKFLFEGYVDGLQSAGVTVYGPSRAASFLEESKIKSKIFMKEFGIPTSRFETANSLVEAKQTIESNSDWAGYVLKLSGPALGKGVIVCSTKIEALEAATQFFAHMPPGIEEGMVIEEKISGREVSLFYACSGESYQFLASACDHKRLKNNDEGPNTGGMGAYSPCHWIDESFLARVEQEVVKPTLAGMISQETPFAGTLFLGLMVNEGGYSLLEYNTRFGDPETQTILPILKGNFTRVLFAAANRTLGKVPVPALSTQNQFALHVVKAAKGYPGLFGEKIEFDVSIQISESKPTGATIFYAGVKEDDDSLKTSGGRVLGITGVGSSFEIAKQNAYQNLEKAVFSGEQFRTDIGGASVSLNVALFASGAGTNALNLLMVARELKNLKIVLLVVDQVSSPLPKVMAEKFPEVQVSVIPAPADSDPKLRKRTHEQAMVRVLKEAKVDWIFLAGYMRMVGETLLNEYSRDGNSRIVNIHPSLLPAYPGLYAYERAFESGDSTSGITIHFVDAGMDTGPTLIQEKFERKNSDTFHDFVERGKAIEWNLYARVLKTLDQNQILTAALLRDP